MAAILGRERRLAEALEQVRDDYEFIVVDCPPSLGLLTVNALTAADSVLIPVQCEYYALEGLSKLLNSIQLVQRYLNPSLAVEGVLLTMYDERLQLSKRVAAEVKSYFGDKVYNSVIKRNVSLAAAPSFGKPVILFEPRSTGAENYRLLAGEVGRAYQPSFA
jgi:chromosome partitioning protein